MRRDDNGRYDLPEFLLSLKVANVALVGRLTTLERHTTI